MQFKFECDICGSDKFKLTMLENLQHETQNRKTFPKHINFSMFAKNENHTAFVGTCSGCGCYWPAWDTLEDLQKVMADAGVLKCK